MVQEGRGEAIYEIGVHDDGDLVGITQEECAASILALFHMTRTLGAQLDVTQVRLGSYGYSVQLRVTQPQEHIDPEVQSFMRGLNMLRASTSSQEMVKLQHRRSESAPVLIDINEAGT